jgi:hypothetical protein
VTELSTGIRVHPSPDPTDGRSQLRVGEVEGLLTDWFGAPVILTSSGRSAILLALTELGFNRYRHRIAIPRLISACVLEALIRRGFPIDVADGSGADATLLYHQFGFPQLGSQASIEDICHAFFASAGSGRREWCAPIAIFSLPKFFTTASMIGGLVVSDDSLFHRLRERRDSTPESLRTERAWLGEVFRSQYQSGGKDLEHLFLCRLVDPRIYDDELGSLFHSVDDIIEIGQRRRQISDALLAVAGHTLPPEWQEMLDGALPFLFPVMGEDTELRRIVDAMKEAGIACDIYQIDRRRNMWAPELVPAILLPCHHDVDPATVHDMVSILSRHKD